MRKTILIILISTTLSSPAFCSLFGRPKPKKEDASRSKNTSRSPADSGFGVVQSIEFQNNREYKANKLLKKLDFMVGDYLDPVLAESGRITLADFYRSKGYPYAEVILNKKKLSEGKVVYTIVAGPRIRILSVKFKGNKSLKSRDLHQAIKTGTREWVFWPAYYTEEKIAADVEKLRSLYWAEGFLNHRIGVEGQAHVTFIIEEGPCYDVNDIVLQGNTHFDNETLLAGLELEPGQTYHYRKAQAHAKEILQLYRENGFIDATVRQDPNFVAEPNVVDVFYTINEGKQFRIGKVDIIGNKETQDKVFRRIMDEYDFVPGELYNAHMAPRQGNGQLERYLRTMTSSERVIIQPVKPADGSEDRMDAEVDIKEGLTGAFNPGVSVGSDSGIIGQFILSQRNFDYKDWPESFDELIRMQAFKGAGQKLTMTLAPGTYVSYYAMSFTEPYFRNKPTSLNVSGSSWERWRESYDEKRTKGYFGFEKRYKSSWRGQIGFRLENVEVKDLEIDAPQEIIDVKGYNLLMGAKFGIGKDATDDRFEPSKGYEFNVSYEQVTGDDDFGILEGSLVGYKTLYEDFLERKTVLATKLLAGATFSDAPPFEKYYAGGTRTYGLRGFEYRGVSTRGLQTGVLNPVRKDPIGSDWIFLANTEIIMPLIGENISALFFMDSGTVDTGRYRFSVGTGIEIVIPQLLGSRVPMRFEIATPLRKDDSDETQTFSFYMGRLF
ncbi:MAG: BamA/TamA family outer membrane protein [Sedimentisphaerales bacterium]|nr:BamA/TamA family outer membrane protein [Sedimentisphaerales bacterium]